jgi:BirA family biotin operon repressor/biotin-[acetyl-CoA-carboxylase] ligase
MNIYLEKTDSTNLVAKEKAAELPHGSAVFAEEQTAGRGRFGRGFYSPPGTGIYMSVILRDVPSLALVTPAAAVAVCRAVRKLTGKPTQIKWVNDILLGGRKLCGILSEAVNDCVIVGIGINFTTDFSAHPELAAVSLFESGEAPVCTREALSDCVIKELCDLVKNMNFMNEYRELSCLIGEEISYMHNNEKRFGRVTGIDDMGRLLLGDTALSSGEVMLVRRV